MKKTKRLVAVLLAVLLLASTLSVPASAKAFPDVYRGSNFLDAVNYVSDNRIIVGEDDGKFYPGNPVTRCQAIAILWRLEGRPPASNKNKFTDVRDDDYFAPAVTWGVNNGIVAGKTNTTFAPHESVSRQDAITFFYRYATKLSGHNPYGRTKSISGCFDYSQVDSYATAAMQWGLGSDLIQLAGNSLSPLRAMTRGEFAKAVTNYGTNVRRIIGGKDNFSFSNYNFYGAAYMNDDHEAQFLAAASKYMDATDYHNFYTSFTSGACFHSGLCYGMVVAEVLDKLGKIAFNENFSSSSNMHSISYSSESDVESALTYYYYSQRFIAYKSSTKGVIPCMNACMDSAGPVLLAYDLVGHSSDPDAKYHAILVNSCTKSGSTYKMEVYNPNYTGMIRATLEPSGAIKYEGHPEDNATITNVEVITDFSDFDMIDIDGYQNTGSTSYSISAEANEPGTPSSEAPGLITDDEPESVLFDITPDGPFHLENAEGEYLDWDGTKLTGTMKHWGKAISFPASHIPRYVHTSETFTFTSQGDNTKISVSSHIQLNNVEGTGIASVTVEDGCVSLEGASMDFALLHRTYDYSPGYISDSSLPYVHLEAHAEGVATMNASTTEYTVEGISGDYTLQTMYSKDDIRTVVEGIAEPGEAIIQFLSDF